MDPDDRIPIESAIPSWPRSNRFENNWIGLHKHGFFFTHEPSFELEDQNLKDLFEPDLNDFDARRDFFCVPSVEYQRLRSVLENSKGGSVLITGYRGTGKSSLVKYTLHRLKADYATQENRYLQKSRNPLNPEYLDIRLNLSSVQNAEQVLPMMFKEFHEAICVQKKVKVSGPIFNEIITRFKKTTHSSRTKSLVGLTGVGRTPSMETHHERKPSTTAEIQSDLFHCVNHVFNENIKVVFVFDEIDKIAPLRERTAVSQERLKQLQDIVGELKFILTESNAYHIFVAGKDVDDSWQEDQNKGEGLFESIFTLNIYLPSFFTPRLQYTLGPHRRWVLQKFENELDTIALKHKYTPYSESSIDDKLYSQLFRQTMRRYRTIIGDLIYFCIHKIGLLLLLLLISVIVFSFLVNSLFPDKFERVPDLPNKWPQWILFSIFLVTALFFTFRIGGEYLRGIQRIRSNKTKQRYVKRDFAKRDWQNYQKKKSTQRAIDKSIDEKEKQFIHSLLAELNISRKSWSFRTALLILPHLAEYEIKGILYRRYERLKVLQKNSEVDGKELSESEMHNRELARRKSFFEIEFLERLVGGEEELNNRFGVDIPSERKIRRLKLFIQYATYKGRGIPRKILREFYSFVTHRGIIKEHQYNTKYWLKRDDVDFIFNIPHPIQRKMSFFADITAHLERQMYFFRSLDDKGIVSTFHIIDFFLKFYQTGFSRRDIYNANFMIRRQELFPSQPLVERVMDMLSGFLISPIGETSPDFRLMPRIQSDLAKLYLNFGPDQLELRFTEAEFNVELNELNEVIDSGLSIESVPKIESYRAESRKGRIYELLGNNFKARIAYSRAIRWILSDLHHQVTNLNDNEKQVYDIEIQGGHKIPLLKLPGKLPIKISRKNSVSPSFHEKYAADQILTYISEIVFLYLRLAQSHDVMNELDQALAYQNRAIILALSHSEISQKSLYRLQKNKDIKVKKFKLIFTLFTTNENFYHNFVTVVKKLKKNKDYNWEKKLSPCPKEFSMVILGGLSNLHDFLFNKKHYRLKPELKEGEPLGIVTSLIASALVHEKLNERTAANETLLMGLFYLASTQNEYGIIDHLITMGNLACRRRNLNQAWTVYDLALSGITRLRGTTQNDAKILNTLDYSRVKQAELLRHLADIHSAVGARIIKLGVSETNSDKKFWNWIQKKFSSGFVDTRKNEYLYRYAQHIYETVGDKLGVIDTLIIRLSVRNKRLQALFNDDIDQHTEGWKILLLETVSSFFKGARVTLVKLTHTTTEKGRIDPTSENEIIDHRRLGRLYEVIGLFLQNLGEYENDAVNEVLDYILKKGATLPSTMNSRKVIEEIRKDRAVAVKSYETINDNKPLEAANKTITDAAKETLDLTSIRTNIEALLSFILANNFSVSDSEDKSSKLCSWRSLVHRLKHIELKVDPKKGATITDNSHLIGSLNKVIYENSKDSETRGKYCDFLAEKCMLFSVVLLKKCIRDINASRANFEIGRFYLRKLLDSYSCLKEYAFNNKASVEEVKLAGRCYRWLYLASKRYLTAAIDILRDEKQSMRRNETLVGEVYSTLADLMLFRRIAIEEIPQWHQFPQSKSYLKEIDDHLALDVQNQAFQNAILALESHTKELTDYISLFPIPHDIHYQHHNINNPLGHFEICTSISRRIIKDYRPPEEEKQTSKKDKPIIQGSRIELNMRLSQIASIKNIVLPQGSHFTPSYKKFCKDFSKVLECYNKYRYLRGFYGSKGGCFIIKENSTKLSTDGLYFRTQDDELCSPKY